MSSSIDRSIVQTKRKRKMLKEPISVNSTIVIRNAVENDCDDIIRLIKVRRKLIDVDKSSFDFCSIEGIGDFREVSRRCSNQQRK